MAVRLKDIAQDLGVSTVTVSKVLRGNLDVGEQTRARVLKRMKELNYQPNMMARGLARGRTYAIGLVVPDLVQPFFAEFAKALSGELRKSSLALILGSSEDDPEIERQEIRTFLNRGVEVLILASCQASPKEIYELGEQRTPYLLFDRNFAHLSANFVGSDDVLVGKMATQHLLQIGRKRIAHIGGRHTSPAQDRLRGYRLALEEARFPVLEARIMCEEHVEESGDSVGFQAMQSLLQQSPPPDAVFCYNDLTAIGAIEAILHAGLSVPGDVAVIGCGNLRYADYLRVPLSSIDHRTTELARLVAEVTLELTAKPEQPVKMLLTEPKLIVRASTGGGAAAD